jgi:hypothetical protein
MSLIVIANHLLHDANDTDLYALGVNALAMVVVFYVIMLFVAARQAAKWGSGEEAVEAS